VGTRSEHHSHLNASVVVCVYFSQKTIDIYALNQHLQIPAYKPYKQRRSSKPREEAMLIVLYSDYGILTRNQRVQCAEPSGKHTASVSRDGHTLSHSLKYEGLKGPLWKFCRHREGHRYMDYTESSSQPSLRVFPCGLQRTLQRGTRKQDQFA
jgi:hypothetical protein